MTYLGVDGSGIEVPANRQDVIAALESVPSTKALIKSVARIPANSSQWMSTDVAAVTIHMCKAAALGNIESMQKLVALGASVSASAPPWSDTALHAAARFDQIAAVEWLLARGARVQAKSIEGWTPLMMAALAGSDQVAVALLSKGARADTRAIPPLSLDALDCCDLAGLARSHPLARRLEVRERKNERLR
jgi:ankyrin repeat protein